MRRARCVRVAAPPPPRHSEATQQGAPRVRHPRWWSPRRGLSIVMSFSSQRLLPRELRRLWLPNFAYFHFYTSVHQTGHRVDLTEPVWNKRVEVDTPAPRGGSRFGPMAEAGGDTDGLRMNAFGNFCDRLSAHPGGSAKQDFVAIGNAFPGGG